MDDRRFVYASAEFIAHPLHEHLQLTPANAAASRAAEPGRNAMVIVDARVTAPQALADHAAVVAQTLAFGTPLLLLSPSTAHLEALQAHLPIVRTLPCEAMIVATSRNAAGGTDVELSVLAYPSANEPRDDRPSSGTVRREGAPEIPEPLEGHGAGPCCPPLADEPLFSKQILFQFADEVRRYADTGAPVRSAANASIPDGLKYFRHVVNVTQPLTYKEGEASNRNASCRATWTIWGFLDQRADGDATKNSQFLIVSGDYNANVGQLWRDEASGRGFVQWRTLTNTRLLKMKLFAHEPNAGKNTWSGTLKVPISYKDPLGRYDFYNYEETIAQTIEGYSVGSGVTGDQQTVYANWYVNTPFNGADPWTSAGDAFKIWGVQGFPDAARTNVAAREATALHSWDTLLTGKQQLALAYAPDGMRFWCPSYSPGVCWTWSWQACWVSVTGDVMLDFTPITP
jgi:hypothetical protein